MLETEDEIREIKKEIVESRGLIIKTNNLTTSLAADINSIAKRQAVGERRAFWNSAVAYVLFATLSFVALKLLSDTRIREIEAEKNVLMRKVEGMRREFAQASKESERRLRAERQAEAFYELIRNNKKREAVKQYAALRNEPLSATEAKVFQAAIVRFRRDLALETFQNAITLARNGRYAEASDTYKRALELSEQGAEAAAIRYELARTLYKLDKHDEAIALAQAVMDQSDDRNLHDDAAWLLSHVYEDKAKLDDARSILQTLLRRWPQSEYAASARKRLGSLVQKARTTNKRNPGK
ncbi:MAG: tetratricopeptide repeat protein [Myxococcales bacterium]|nr:tetratricopeptide repeat protein [Myxococcales bacterium]